MSARITSFEIVGNSAGRWRWTGTPPFYVFGANGDALLNGTNETEIMIDATDYMWSPTIEVLDSTQISTKAPASIENPACVVLQWFGINDASYYRIDIWNGTEWEPASPRFDQYPRHVGQRYYQWRSTVLNDGTHARYRVVPVREFSGTIVDGDPIEFDAVIHRNPELEIYGAQWTYDWNETTHELIIGVNP
jgi:hypothetical protein